MNGQFGYGDEILNLYLKQDLKDDVKYPFLFNTENTYKTFIKNLHTIFNRKIFIKNTGVNKKLYLKFSNMKMYLSDISYLNTFFTSSSYDIILEFEITLIEDVTNENGEVVTNVINIQRQSDIYRARIPAYVGYKGENPLGTSNINNGYTFGGFFIQNKGMKKYMSARKDTKNTNPKVKDNHITFNSITPRDEINSIIQYISLQLNITADVFKFDLSSNNTINANIIILIKYYLRLDLDTIENIILNSFSDEVKEQARIIFIKTNLVYQSYNNNISSYLYSKTESSGKGIDKNNVAEKFLELINSFLPHLNTNEEKGMYLINIVRQYFVIIFQQNVYPHRDHMVGKRISPVGFIFEEIILNTISGIVNEFRGYLKQNKKYNEIYTALKLDNKFYNMFGNIFNMKDNNTKKLIKPSTNIFATGDIVFPNLIVHGGTVILTKVLSSRNNELSTICFEDNIDTPDNPENVGLVKRISVATRITYYTFEEQKAIKLALIKIIKECVKTNDIINKPIVCNIVDMSEFPICFINEEECDLIIKTIKHYKINNFENLRFVGIEKIPQYEFNNDLRIDLPNNKTFQLNINYGSKRYYKPFMVINDGVPEVFKIPSEEFKTFECFTDFVEKYPGAIEYLDPGQVTYSVICEDLPTFIKLNEKDKKKYEYINLNSSSNFGIVAASGFDLGRMAGARATHVCAQQKQVLVQMCPDVYNRFEGGNALLNPFERPCISNSILEASGISQFGKGQHINVAFCSFKDNIEDGLIFRKKSIERGLLDALTIAVFKNVITNSQLNVITPERTNNNYSKLQDDGLPAIGTILTKNDAIHKKIKTIYRKVGDTEVDYANDASEPFNNAIPGRVERTEKTGSDNLNINILTSLYKPLNVGDKVVNQGAQKGTIGIIMEDHELPHTEDGCVPDVIFNSTSILSRNTLSLYLQIILTNVYGYFPLNEEGTDIIIQDYPTFTNIDINEVLSDLRKKFEEKFPKLSKEEIEDKLMCNVDMYDYYGNKYPNKIFFGPLMYSRSNQMSIDKISVRNGGRLSKSGVPVSGKKRNGGQRSGEMEMDALCVHGVSNILHEHTSDVNTIKAPSFWCSKCSTPATKDIVNGKVRWYCIPCQEQGFITGINKESYTQAFRLCKELLRCRKVDMKIKRIPEEAIYPFQSSN